MLRVGALLKGKTVGFCAQRPFTVNPVEVAENQEAVMNGLSATTIYAIQRFFGQNIQSPLGANIYSLFVSGVLGATGHLSDAKALNVFFVRFRTRAMGGGGVSMVILFCCYL